MGETVSLEKLVQAVIHLHLNDSEKYEFELADRQLIREIVYCRSVDELYKVITEYAIWDLPLVTGIILHKRIVELERNADNLRNLANYLQLHGSDWDDEAHSFIQEAKNLENSKK